MRLLAIAALLIVHVTAVAETKIKMDCKNESILKVIETYARATGQKFIVDPSVRGNISIFLPEPVGPVEAFEHLSTALASNGFGITRQGDTMTVKPARRVQRDLIEVTEQLPAMKPQRMATYVYTARNIPVNDINREIRILTSMDGEIVPHIGTNQILITDWTPNLARIDQILKKIDVKPGPEAAAQVAIEKENQKARQDDFKARHPKFRKEN